MSDDDAPRGPGRPPDPAKQAAVLAAARRLFFGAGPYALTMEAVAREAGVSKATVYARYPNREALIEAVVIDQQERLTVAIRVPPADAGSMRDSLLAFAVELLAFLVGEEALGLQRLMASHGPRNAALGEIVYARGPRATCERLARWLDAMAARGALRPGDSLRAAEEFVGMLQGDLVTGLLFCGRGRPGEDEIRARAGHAVDSFLRAWRS